MKNIGTVLTALLCFASVTSAQFNNTNGNGRSAVIKINSVESPWAESRLSEKLTAELSRNGNGEIIKAEVHINFMPPFPSDIYSTDSLSNWGIEAGRRYVIVIAIESERLRKKKSFNIPLVVSKYENVGEVIGELRIADASRRRVVLAERFKFEKEAKRKIQAMPNDDINDADLHISAPEKLRLFSELESQLAKELAEKIRSATNLK